jgi:imidazolonepropionase-like amidohydrolase
MKHLLLCAVLVTGCLAQTTFSSEVQKYVSVSAPTIALTHVKLIDGTGASALDDQTIVTTGGKISSIGPAASARPPADAKVLDLHGYTVIPGLVGMHNHFYDSAFLNRDDDGRILPPGFLVTEIPYTAPRLYLAAGVTTLRTTGNVEGFTDLEVKHRVDAGLMPGPHIDASAPYLEGEGSVFGQMHQLKDADDARRNVDFWADEGVTSFKAYMNITRDELAAAIQEAHKRGFKLTGHLCSVTWPEAIAAGIDDFEHGPVFTDTEFNADKKPDKCPMTSTGAAWAKLDINSAEVQGLIHNLVEHNVAVTSTLPVFDAGTVNTPPNPRVLEAMSVTQRQNFLTARSRITPEANTRTTGLIRKEMEFERAFVKAGGLLLAGPDPTGNGGTLPGFGDWRGLELLVDAGFTPAEAIQIATQNGAKFMGRDGVIGTIAPGKNADIVVIHGDPTAKISDVEKVEIVFKDGIGYDSAKLIDACKGTVGLR